MIVLRGDNSGILDNAWDLASPANMYSPAEIQTAFIQIDLILFPIVLLLEIIELVVPHPRLRNPGFEVTSR